MILTPREVEVIGAIRRLTALHRQPPTRVELGRALGISSVAAHLHVNRLRDKGVLRVRPRQHRGIALAICPLADPANPPKP